METRILYPHTRFYPIPLGALTAFAPGAELVDTSGSPFAYWAEIAARWTGEADLVIIEQDIEIHEQVMPGFAECPAPWCVYPYQVRDRETLLDFGLGCVRFRAAAQLMVTEADIFAQPGFCELCHGAQGCWMHLDCQIAWAMQAHGLIQCIHWPGVIHHNPEVVSAPRARRMRWQRIDPDLRDDAQRWRE